MGRSNVAINVRCVCGRQLRVGDNFAGATGKCPACGRSVKIPSTASASTAGAATGSEANPAAIWITEFLDPAPASPRPPGAPARPALRRMFEALLDPQSILWMLLLGGCLAVLGLIVWLVSLGVFDDPRVLAALFALVTLAILAAGWAVTLKTRYRTAGRALTFLGCIVAPLNLWFYHAQGLLTLDDRLWIGGVVCCLLYAATLFVLRDAVFIYAVEGGVTLTVMLLLAEIGAVSDPAALSLCLLALAMISIHVDRAFPVAAQEFDRRRYGMPWFWSGHVQLAAALLILFGSQLLNFVAGPLSAWLSMRPPDNLLTQNHWLAGAIWLAGAYAYIYSDLVVRRVGAYASLSALCLVMAEITLLRLIPSTELELLIAGALAVTALVVNLSHGALVRTDQRLGRAVPPIGLLLSAVPLAIGWIVHVRATSAAARAMDWGLETGWLFVVVMLIVAVSNRISAWVYRHESPQQATAYFFLGAAALILAAAGFLRSGLGLTEAYQQAPLVMLIPMGCILAARWWRGQPEERPLTWVAHTAAAVILAHVVLGSIERLGIVVRPVTGRTENLYLGLVFVEAALFYILVGLISRRGVNAYLATAAACGALWQWLGYFDVDDTWHTMLYALLGVATLILARSLGLEQVVADGEHEVQVAATRGRGWTAFKCGNAILSVALLSALLQGLADLATREPTAPTAWLSIFALALTTLASLAAILLVPAGAWRRWYGVAAIWLAGLTFLTLTIPWMQQLSPWQKLELFCVVIGASLLIASHVGLFRESEADTEEMVSFGLLVGSALATLPLVIAVFSHRFFGGGPSLVDEFALITVTAVMLVTGVSWQIRATTLLGGGTLAVYLALVVVSLARVRQVEVGVYLAVGGAVIFAIGIALSIYRDRLLELPDRIARREGIFRIINWR